MTKNNFIIILLIKKIIKKPFLVFSDFPGKTEQHISLFDTVLCEENKLFWHIKKKKNNFIR